MQLTDKERIDKLELENEILKEREKALINSLWEKGIRIEREEPEENYFIETDKESLMPTKRQWQEHRLKLLESYINNTFIIAGWDNKQDIFIVEFEELAKELSVKYGVYVNPKEDYRTTVKIIID